jgi:hypothetical protein
MQPNILTAILLSAINPHGRTLGCFLLMPYTQANVPSARTDFSMAAVLFLFRVFGKHD